MKDYSTPEGASELARLITRYWAQRGHTVHAGVEEGDYFNALRTRSYPIRSDMINGLPRECQEEAQDHGGQPSRPAGGSRAGRDADPSPRPGRSVSSAAAHPSCDVPRSPPARGQASAGGQSPLVSAAQAAAAMGKDWRTVWQEREAERNRVHAAHLAAHDRTRAALAVRKPDRAPGTFARTD